MVPNYTQFLFHSPCRICSRNLANYLLNTQLKEYVTNPTINIATATLFRLSLKHQLQSVGNQQGFKLFTAKTYLKKTFDVFCNVIAAVCFIGGTITWFSAAVYLQTSIRNVLGLNLGTEGYPH
jgi:hypothetical protein